nr:ATP-binding protein [uncultured Brachybacterium sp.]
MNQRYLKNSIVTTTNRPVGAWGEILSDTTVAAAILDRLLHRSGRGHPRRHLLQTPPPSPHN